ncbi:lytic transglycosylase domain-containing protein [Azospirillum sp. ST 5-10]|uniref:lytic transglycosylase domain-containing protein n=1 Tax=unclassified Azospirillum TaxID=2630922 RepID=UPI003F49D32C
MGVSYPALAPHITAASQRFGLDPKLIASLIRAESGGDPTAVSRAGARGVMQVMPATYAHMAPRLGLAGDPMDPANNIMAGAGYLRDMMDRYNGDTRLALAAYNGGPTRLDARERDVSRMPAETQAYVKRVMGGLGGLGGVEAPVLSGSVGTDVLGDPGTDQLQTPAAPAALPQISGRAGMAEGLALLEASNALMSKKGRGLLGALNTLVQGLGRGLIAGRDVQEREDRRAAMLALQDPNLADEQKRALLARAAPEAVAASEIGRLYPKTSLPTDDMREYEFAKSQGFTGSFADWQTQMKRAAVGGARYGNTPIYGKDAQGRDVILQIGSDGTAVQTPLPEGVSLAPGVERVDLGTHWGLVDRSGNLTGTLAKDLAGAERDKKVGQAEGERIADAPNVALQADRMLASIDGVLGNPVLEKSTGMLAWTSALPGTEMYDFGQQVQQLQGQAFLQAFDTLRGGGQITEVEGKKATDAIARLSQAQTSEGFRRALGELRSVVDVARQRAQERAAQGRGGGETTAPLPSNRSDWKSGSVYQTPGGRARYLGNDQWEIVGE